MSTRRLLKMVEDVLHRVRRKEFVSDEEIDDNFLALHEVKKRHSVHDIPATLRKRASPHGEGESLSLHPRISERTHAAVEGRNRSLCGHIIDPDIGSKLQLSDDPSKVNCLRCHASMLRRRMG